MATDTKTRTLIKEVVEQTLLSLGFNIDDPEEVLELQQDRHYVRAARLRSESIGNNSLQHVINVVISGTLAAIGLWLLQR